LRAVRLARLALSLAFVVLAAAGCGDEEGEPTTTQRVTVQTPEFCRLTEQRREIAKDLPALPGLELRNADIDNFVANSAMECNERQLIFWGPPPALSGQNRAEIEVRLYMARDATEAKAALESTPPARRTRVSDGELLHFPGQGLYAVRFVSGAAVVTVTAGCANVDSARQLGAVSCRRPPVARSFLRRRAVDAAESLERQLRGRLDA
jgi:hypothetical protein